MSVMGEDRPILTERLLVAQETFADHPSWSAAGCLSPDGSHFAFIDGPGQDVLHIVNIAKFRADQDHGSTHHESEGGHARGAVRRFSACAPPPPPPRGASTRKKGMHPDLPALPAGEGLAALCWSPDGRSVAVAGQTSGSVFLVDTSAVLLFAHLPPERSQKKLPHKLPWAGDIAALCMPAPDSLLLTSYSRGDLYSLPMPPPPPPPPPPGAFGGGGPSILGPPPPSLTLKSLTPIASFKAHCRCVRAMALDLESMTLAVLGEGGGGSGGLGLSFWNLRGAPQGAAAVTVEAKGKPLVLRPPPPLPTSTSSRPCSSRSPLVEAMQWSLSFHHPAGDREEGEEGGGPHPPSSLLLAVAAPSLSGLVVVSVDDIKVADIKLPTSVPAPGSRGEGRGPEVARDAVSVSWWGGGSSLLAACDSQGHLSVLNLPGCEDRLAGPAGEEGEDEGGDKSIFPSGSRAWSLSPYLGLRPSQQGEGTGGGGGGGILVLQPLSSSSLPATSPSPSTPGGGGGGGWRLSLLLERSPEVMVAAHAKAGRWKEVFQVAEGYGMDRDEVYRLRWTSQEVEARSIQENLRPMADRFWIAEECATRVAGSAEGQRLLLQFGLKVAAENCMTATGELLDGSDPDASHIRWWRRMRLLLLRHQDRLDTLLALHAAKSVTRGGASSSSSSYLAWDGEAYAAFRDEDLMAAALVFAAAGDHPALSVLLQRHPLVLGPHLLEVLEGLPECMDPRLYANLLPKADGTLLPQPPLLGALPSQGGVGGRLEADWVEVPETAEQLRMEGYVDQLARATDYMWEVTCKIGLSGGLPCHPPSTQQVSSWYRQRALTLDSTSGQLQHSLTLLEIGVQRGFSSDPDLVHLKAVAEAVNRALAHFASSSSGWDLATFASLTPQDQLMFLLSGSTLTAAGEGEIPLPEEEGEEEEEEGGHDGDDGYHEEEEEEEDHEEPETDEDKDRLAQLRGAMAQCAAPYLGTLPQEMHSSLASSLLTHLINKRPAWYATLVKLEANLLGLEATEQHHHQQQSHLFLTAGDLASAVLASLRACHLPPRVAGPHLTSALRYTSRVLLTHQEGEGGLQEEVVRAKRMVRAGRVLSRRGAPVALVSYAALSTAGREESLTVLRAILSRAATLSSGTTTRGGGAAPTLPSSFTSLVYSNPAFTAWGEREWRRLWSDLSLAYRGGGLQGVSEEEAFADMLATTLRGGQAAITASLLASSSQGGNQGGGGLVRPPQLPDEMVGNIIAAAASDLLRAPSPSSSSSILDDDTAITSAKALLALCPASHGQGSHPPPPALRLLSALPKIQALLRSSVAPSASSSSALRDPHVLALLPTLPDLLGDMEEEGEGRERGAQAVLQRVLQAGRALRDHLQIPPRASGAGGGGRTSGGGGPGQDGTTASSSVQPLHRRIDELVEIALLLTPSSTPSSQQPGREGGQGEGSDEGEVRSQVMLLAATAAISAGDTTAATSLALQLAGRRYGPAWRVAATLGMEQQGRGRKGAGAGLSSSAASGTATTRFRLLSFAAAQCDAEALPQLLEEVAAGEGGRGAGEAQGAEGDAPQVLLRQALLAAGRVTSPPQLPSPGDLPLALALLSGGSPLTSEEVEGTLTSLIKIKTSSGPGGEGGGGGGGHAVLQRAASLGIAVCSLRALILLPPSLASSSSGPDLGAYRKGLVSKSPEDLLHLARSILAASPSSDEEARGNMVVAERFSLLLKAAEDGRGVRTALGAAPSSSGTSAVGGGGGASGASTSDVFMTGDKKSMRRAVLQQATAAGHQAAKEAGAGKEGAKEGGLKLLDQALSLARSYEAAEEAECRTRWIIEVLASSTVENIVKVSDLVASQSLLLLEVGGARAAAGLAAALAAEAWPRMPSTSSHHLSITLTMMTKCFEIMANEASSSSQAPSLLVPPSQASLLLPRLLKTKDLLIKAASATQGLALRPILTALLAPYIQQALGPIWEVLQAQDYDTLGFTSAPPGGVLLVAPESAVTSSGGSSGSRREGALVMEAQAAVFEYATSQIHAGHAAKLLKALQIIFTTGVSLVSSKASAGLPPSLPHLCLLLNLTTSPTPRQGSPPGPPLSLHPDTWPLAKPCLERLTGPQLRSWLDFVLLQGGKQPLPSGAAGGKLSPLAMTDPALRLEILEECLPRLAAAAAAATSGGDGGASSSSSSSITECLSRLQAGPYLGLRAWQALHKYTRRHPEDKVAEDQVTLLAAAATASSAGAPPPGSMTQPPPVLGVLRTALQEMAAAGCSIKYLLSILYSASSPGPVASGVTSPSTMEAAPLEQGPSVLPGCFPSPGHTNVVPSLRQFLQDAITGVTQETLSHLRVAAAGRHQDQVLARLGGIITSLVAGGGQDDPASASASALDQPEAGQVVASLRDAVWVLLQAAVDEGLVPSLSHQGGGASSSSASSASQGGWVARLLDIQASLLDGKAPTWPGWHPPPTTTATPGRHLTQGEVPPEGEEGEGPASASSPEVLQQQVRLLLGRTIVALGGLWPQIQVTVEEVASKEAARNLLGRLLEDALLDPRRIRVLEKLLSETWAEGRVWKDEEEEDALALSPAGWPASPLADLWGDLAAALLRSPSPHHHQISEVVRLVDLTRHLVVAGQQPGRATKAGRAGGPHLPPLSSEGVERLIRQAQDQTLTWDPTSSSPPEGLISLLLTPICLGLLSPKEEHQERALGQIKDLPSVIWEATGQLDSQSAVMVSCLVAATLASLPSQGPLPSPALTALCTSQGLWTAATSTLARLPSYPFSSCEEMVSGCLFPVLTSSLVLSGLPHQAASLTATRLRLHPTLASLEGGLVLLERLLRGVLAGGWQVTDTVRAQLEVLGRTSREGGETPSSPLATQVAWAAPYTLLAVADLMSSASSPRGGICERAHQALAADLGVLPTECSR